MKTLQIQKRSMGTKIKPGDDFYTYVNEVWLRAHPIPPEKARLGSMTILQDENIEKLKVLLEQTNPNTEPNIAKVRSFYRAAMDEAAIEKNGLGSLTNTLEMIKGLTDVVSIQRYIAQQHAQGLSAVWHIGLEIDDKDSSRYILRIGQNGLGLPDRDYYTETSEQLKRMRKEYRHFLKQLFTLLDEADVQAAVSDVEYIETMLAKASATAAERRDPLAKYNLYTLDGLRAAFPSIDWPAYIRTIGAPNAQEIIISQPKFMQEALTLLDTLSISAWKHYLTFHALLPFLAYLPKTYSDIQFAFYGKVLSGMQAQEVRYRRAIGQSMRLLPQPLGQLFVSTYFDESAKKAIYDLASHLREQLKIRIGKLEWMSSATKVRALRKLGSFTSLLGYPDVWRDFGELVLSGVCVDNVLSVIAFDWRYDMQRLHSPVDRKEWLMSPAVVNACYWSSTNTISFPAGILQPPFFDAHGDLAANYGAIGAVIGHEITHGFDDEGSQYDEKGNLVSWWTKTDRAQFDARAKKLREQFDHYIVEGRHVNGALTLGENIADLGGLLLAYDALQQRLTETSERDTVDGMKPEQRFFISWARAWRSQMRPEFMLRMLLSDPHAPNNLRVNGPLSNIDAFYEAFTVQPGDNNYRAPEERVRIW